MALANAPKPHPQLLAHDIVELKKKLEYYQILKNKAAAKVAEIAANSKKKTASPAQLDKWIEIYSDRLKIAEKTAQKIGLRTEL